MDNSAVMWLMRLLTFVTSIIQLKIKDDFKII